MIDYVQFRAESFAELNSVQPSQYMEYGRNFFFGANFEQAIDAVNEHLNPLGSRHFIDEADSPQSHEGIEYKIVGDVDSSKDTAILMPSPFGNGIWPHLVARAEALRHMASEAGVRDSQGNNVPVLMASAPSYNSSYNLTAQERAHVSNGNFEAIAARHLRLLDSLGYSVLRGYVGYSQPSVYGAQIARLAKSDFDITGPIQIQEMPHSKKQARASLAFGMAAIEGARFKKGVQAGRIDVINELFASGNTGEMLNQGVMKNRKDYMSIVKGFSRGRFTEDLEALAIRDIEAFVLWAENSAVTHAASAKGAVEQTKTAYPHASIRAMEIKGANHSYGDMVGHFAVTAAANL